MDVYLGLTASAAITGNYLAHAITASRKHLVGKLDQAHPSYCDSVELHKCVSHPVLPAHARSQRKYLIVDICRPNRNITYNANDVQLQQLSTARSRSAGPVLRVCAADLVG